MNKTDLYNGNIKKECVGLVNFSLIFLVIMLIGLGTMLLLIALLYEKVEASAQIAMFVISGISYASGILYPIITINLVRIYPKHKKLAHAFLKPYVFEENKPQSED